MPIIKTIRNFTPQIDPSCFVAENATIIGEVNLSAHCSVWFNAVLRGDVGCIEVGKNTNIQDGAMLHCTFERSVTVLGEGVTVGHHAIVHGCSVGDFALIGMGAIIMDLAKVGEGAIVAAGSVVLENTKIESYTLYAGVPAKKVKKLDDQQQAAMHEAAMRYVKYAEWYK